MVSIEVPSKKDFPAMAQLYKAAFTTHELFQQAEKKVVQYLENVDGNFLVAREGDKGIGALLWTMKITNGHALVRIRHFAVKPSEKGKGIGIIMLEDIDKKMQELKKEKVASIKIEAHVAETEKVFATAQEKDDLEFWQRNGFKIEGKLQDHYREGEICYIMGKII